MKLFHSCLISVLFFVLVIQRCYSQSAKKFTVNEYLNKYGYIAFYDGKPPDTAYRSAIVKFQRYAGLSVTGQMDSATTTKLNAPRCGATDAKSISRWKRFVKQGTVWKKMDLTYSIHVRQPAEKISSTTVRTTLEKAFKMWQDVSKLTFTRLPDNEHTADIRITFVSGQHGDTTPFDGLGHTLAHGYYPLDNTGLSGDIHFDNDEIWTNNGEEDTTDFTWTATHEIGHVIGLFHSQDSSAIMWPWFEGFKSNLKINRDDINGIQSIYGQPKTGKPNICNKNNFDAVMYHPGTGNTYLFKGRKVWIMNKTRRAANYELISEKWPGLEDNIDAAYTRNDGYTIFFKGDRFWRYQGYVRIEGPKALSNYIKNYRASKLNKIDAVMIWKSNTKTYFFSGSSYWRYDEQKRVVESSYPRNINLAWRNVKYPVDDVMTWKNGKTFFFHDNKIYLFKNKSFIAKIKKNQEKQKISYFIKNCRA